MSLLARAIFADRDIEYAVNEIQNFKITTMTILVSLDSRISIKALVNKDQDSQWNIQQGKFLNCLLFVPKNRKVSIKVFSNGNLHMTGVKTIREALEWGERLGDFLQKCLGQVFRISAFNVQLINGCFALPIQTENSQLCLNTLQELVPKEYPTIFQPDAHPGLRIKYMDGTKKKASIILFRSGKVLMNAFLNGRDLLECYNFLMNIFDEAKENILKTKSATQAFKGFDYAKYLE